MLSVSDWLPLAAIGATFTLLGVLKVYGRCRGIVGGGGKPWDTRLCGSCPTFSRPLNIAMIVLFLVIGLSALVMLGMLLIGGGGR
jgi:hypothetical protein